MRILLIEDSKAMAAYIISGLKRAGHVVDHAKTAEEGLHLLRGVAYDLMLCDVVLPGCSGFDMVKKLRKTNAHLPVLFISARNAVDDRVEGLNIGGDDFLVKPFAFSELLARSEALLRRSRLEAPSKIKDELCEADLRFDLKRGKVFRGSREISLQPLELQLLTYLMRNKGSVLSKTTILEEIWDSSSNPDSNVIQVRMHHLRNKIDKGFSPKLIHTVRGAGYVFEAR